MGKKRKPLSKEHKQKLREASLRSGNKPPSHKGKKRSEESKKKYSESKKGNKNPNFGKSLSNEQKSHLKNVMKGTRTGSNNPAWRGGRTKLSQSIRNLSQYTEWRTKIFERDNFTCQKCGQKGGYLEAHHTKPFKVLLKTLQIRSVDDAIASSKLWDVSVGVTLCKHCHSLTKEGKPSIKGLVYIAGPYSSENTIDVFNNMRRGMRASTEFLLNGWAPFCPFIDYHYQLQLRDGESLSVQNYYDYSLSWLEVCDKVYVLKGWEGSKGTLNEIKRAEELGIVVEYEDSKGE